MITEIEQFEYTVTKSIESDNKERQSTYGCFIIRWYCMKKKCYTGITKFLTVYNKC
jgi:hypothetical protein